MPKTKKPKENKTDKLEKARQELFCILYAGGKQAEYFGNGLKSYSKAYGYEERITKAEEELVVIRYAREDDRKKKRQEILNFQNTCRVCASKLLTNANIIARCDNLLNSLFDADHMDRELARAATQNKDISSKVAAIREFNRVKNRVEEKVINNNTIYQWATDEDLRKGAKLPDKK